MSLTNLSFSFRQFTQIHEYSSHPWVCQIQTLMGGNPYSKFHTSGIIFERKKKQPTTFHSTIKSLWGKTMFSALYNKINKKLIILIGSLLTTFNYLITGSSPLCRSNYIVVAGIPKSQINAAFFFLWSRQQKNMVWSGNTKKKKY